MLLILTSSRQATGAMGSGELAALALAANGFAVAFAPGFAWHGARGQPCKKKEGANLRRHDA